MPLLFQRKNSNQRNFGRWLLVTGVVIAWLIFGYCEGPVSRELQLFYQKLFSSLGLPVTFLQGEPDQVNGVVKSSKLVIMSYGLIYCGLSLLIIHIYFLNFATTKLALGLYGCMGVLYLVFKVPGELLNMEPLSLIAFRIMTILFSPMPIVLLIPALYLVSTGTRKEVTEKPVPVS